MLGTRDQLDSKKKFSLMEIIEDDEEAKDQELNLADRK